MRFIKLEDITKGMVLAKPIYNDNGGIMVREGNPISDAVLRHIDGIGYQGLYVEDDLSDDIVVRDIVSEKLRRMAYDALVKGDYTLCASIGKSIAQEIYEQQRNLSLDMIDIKSFKNYEYNHCIAVCVYATVIGVKMKLTPEQLDNLAIAGLLHDIGKFDVKRRVLNTKQIYSDKQMDEMKKHPMYSYEALKEDPNISSVTRNSILFHHENIDGTGYYGISGDKLGLFPRILRVCDTYDALIATRKHRAAFSPAFAFRNILQDMGTLFDKEVVKIFLTTFPMYPKGYPVVLDNGHEGFVINQTQDPERPIIRLYTGENVNLLTNSDYRTVSIRD